MLRFAGYSLSRQLHKLLNAIESHRLQFWINRIESKLERLERQRRDVEAHTARLILRRADLKCDMHTLPANVIAFPQRRSMTSSPRPVERAVR